MFPISTKYVPPLSTSIAMHIAVRLLVLLKTLVTVSAAEWAIALENAIAIASDVA